MNTRSVEVLIELTEILKSNPLIDKVSTGKVEPLASETNRAAIYIQHPNLVPRLQRNSPEVDGYDYHGYYMLFVNVDCIDDEFRVYDIADSVQRSILNDSQIWGSLIDRDIITVEYDNSEFFPKRSVAIALEVVFRLTCN